MYGASFRFNILVNNISDSFKKEVFELEARYFTPDNFANDPYFRELFSYRNNEINNRGDSQTDHSYICYTLCSAPILESSLPLDFLNPVLLIACIDPEILSKEADAIRARLQGETLDPSPKPVTQIIEYLLNTYGGLHQSTEKFKARQELIVEAVESGLTDLEAINVENKLRPIDHEFIKKQIKALRPNGIKRLINRNKPLSDEQIKQAILKKLRLRTCDAYEYEISMLILMGESLQKEMFGESKHKGASLIDLGSEISVDDLFD